MLHLAAPGEGAHVKGRRRSWAVPYMKHEVLRAVTHMTGFRRLMLPGAS